MTHVLTARQRAFVEAYTASHNGADAARQAGYAERTARFQASRLLTNDNIRSAIAEREARIADDIGITKQRLLEAQWAVFEKAFAGAPKLNRDGEIITYVDPDTKESKVLYDWSPGGANKALETLFRHRGMLTDRHEVQQSAPSSTRWILAPSWTTGTNRMSQRSEPGRVLRPCRVA